MWYSYVIAIVEMLYFIISDKDFALTDILEIIFADAKSACQFLTTIPRFLRLGEPTENFSVWKMEIFLKNWVAAGVHKKLIYWIAKL